MFNGKKFKTFDDAGAFLDNVCTIFVKMDNRDLDPLSDEFGDLVDIEQGEYTIVYVDEEVYDD